MKSHVRWTVAEWDQLADWFLELRTGDPIAPFLEIVNLAQSRFPKARQRAKITSPQQIEPLIDRVRGRAHLHEDRARRIAKLEEELATRPTREEIISSLTDDEIRRLFGHRLLQLFDVEDIVPYLSTAEVLDRLPLDEIAGVTARRLVASLVPQNGITNDSIAPTPIIAPKRARLPRFYVLGAKPNQAREIEQRFRDRAVEIRCPDKNLSVIPEGGDHYFVMASFISHSLREQAPRQRSTFVQGGVTNVISAIEKKL